MNTHIEKELCGFLIQNNDILIPDYPRLNPETVKVLSKNLTRIIYDFIKNENKNTKANRDAVLVSI